MINYSDAIVDMEQFAQCRTKLGKNFIRFLGYFREDGSKSVAIIEEAMRTSSAIGMIEPAQSIKSEAFDLGAVKLAKVAEQIEFEARDRVEWRQSPDDMIEPVIALRKIFLDTVAILEQESSPLMVRHR
jgi:histidine phosphotransfer protein HptB